MPVESGTSGAGMSSVILDYEVTDNNWYRPVPLIECAKL